MKKSILVNGLILLLLLSACQKDTQNLTKNQTKAPPLSVIAAQGHLKQTNTYSSEVVVKWMNLQVRLMAATTGVANVAFVRPYAYSGIALYEAVVPGMPAYQSLAGQLTEMPSLPQTNSGQAYHWAASANTALAAINRYLFPSASDVNKAAIDSLEAALNNQYISNADAATINRSVAFGNAVVEKIISWAEGDGYLHANDPYTPPTGAGLWVPPTVPLPKTSTPYWGNLRLLVPGSTNNAQPGPPIAYSEDPSSGFYKMAKQVYDVSQALTPGQTAMALYWRDVPGVTTPGHFVNIIKQVLEQSHATLDKAALAYALGGIMVYDASVSCWKTKFQYNLVRPITYIRTVLGYDTWSPLLATPGHPEYSSAHAVVSAANAEALTTVFGDNYHFTDHTYDYLGMAPRSYTSFRAIGEEAGASRLYAGIHYQPSINIGLQQGRTVAQNINATLKFLKE